MSATDHDVVRADRGADVRILPIASRTEVPVADDWLSLRDAAARTGISASHLRLLVRTGRVEAKKIGSYWVTTEPAVRAYLADERLRAKDPFKRKRSGPGQQ